MAFLGPLNFHISFSINLSIKKNSSEIFDRDCMKSADQFEEYCHFNNIVF